MKEMRNPYSLNTNMSEGTVFGFSTSARHGRLLLHLQEIRLEPKKTQDPVVEQRESGQQSALEDFANVGSGD